MLVPLELWQVEKVVEKELLFPHHLDELLVSIAPEPPVQQT